MAASPHQPGNATAADRGEDPCRGGLAVGVGEQAGGDCRGFDREGRESVVERHDAASHVIESLALQAIYGE
jgi:hypothetical protein